MERGRTCTGTTALRACSVRGICTPVYIASVNWVVEVHEAFAEELKAYDEDVRLAIGVEVGVLEEFGPQLGRPSVDTLSGSAFANMKEIRFVFDRQIWRVAFAFDPKRQAILLAAGDKRGKDQKRFYKRLIKKADERFLEHLAQQQKKN